MGSAAPAVQHGVPAAPPASARRRGRLRAGHRATTTPGCSSATTAPDAIEAELELLGTPGRYYTTNHGPVNLFDLDSSVPEQLDWLDERRTHRQRAHIWIASLNALVVLALSASLLLLVVLYFRWLTP